MSTMLRSFVVMVLLVVASAVSTPAQAEECGPLPFMNLTFDAPPVGLASGSCYVLSLDGVETVALSSSGGERAVWITDGAGDEVCHSLRGAPALCRLSGSHPLRLSVSAESGVALRLADLDGPGACESLAPTGFNEAPDQLLRSEFGCLTIAGSADQALVTAGNHWSLWGGSTAPACVSREGRLCSLPEGQSTLLFTATGGSSTTSAAVVRLTTLTPGCADQSMPIDWRAAPLTVSQGAPGEIDCLVSEAGSGERVEVLSNAYLAGSVWFDADGRVTCRPQSGTGSCVLEGAPPFRLAVVRSSAYSPTTFGVRAPGLTSRVGCETASVTQWGQLASTDLRPCWSFSPPESGTFLSMEQRLVSEDGSTQCRGLTPCAVNAGDTHLIYSAEPVAADLRSLGSCTTPLAAGFGNGSVVASVVEDQAMCRTFPVADTARFLAAQPLGVEGYTEAAVGIYRPDGSLACDRGWSTQDTPCDVDGSGEHRLVVVPSSLGRVEVGLLDLAAPSGCVPLALSRFGAAGGTQVRIPTDSVLGCLTFPAREMGRRTAFRWDAGSQSARLLVAELEPGTCSGTRGLSLGELMCIGSRASGPATVLVRPDAPGASVAVARWDLESRDGCVDATTTVAGGAETRGQLSGFLEMDCVRVSAEPGARFSTGLWSDTSTRALVAPLAGGCDLWVRERCSRVVEGTEFPVFVRRATGDLPGQYGIEPWHLDTEGVPAPGCSDPLPSRIAVALDGQRTGYCWSPRMTSVYASVLPTRQGDDLPVRAAESNGPECAMDQYCSIQRSVIVSRASIARAEQSATLTFACTSTCHTDSQRLTAIGSPRLDRVPAVGARVGVGGDDIWSTEPDVVSHQWLRDGQPIPGATGPTYVPTAVDLDRGLSVRLVATQGSATAIATSAPQSVAKGAAPRLVRAPRVMGVRQPGQRLRAFTGQWTPQALTYRYTWRLDGRVLQQRTSSVLVRSWWRGRQLRVTVQAIRPGHTWAAAHSPLVLIRR